MDTSIYSRINGNYEQRKAQLAEAPREWLEAAILDDCYNAFCSDHCDDGYERVIPYHGLGWRHIAFSSLTGIPIGRCSDGVGFMAVNKWDYPSRRLTEDEARHVIALIDEAMELRDASKDVMPKLRELNDYMQTLQV